MTLDNGAFRCEVSSYILRGSTCGTGFLLLVHPSRCESCTGLLVYQSSRIGIISETMVALSVSSYAEGKGEPCRGS